MIDINLQSEKNSYVYNVLTSLRNKILIICKATVAVGRASMRGEDGGEGRGMVSGGGERGAAGRAVEYLSPRPPKLRTSRTLVLSPLHSPIDP